MKGRRWYREKVGEGREREDTRRVTEREERGKKERVKGRRGESKKKLCGKGEEWVKKIKR